VTLTEFDTLVAELRERPDSVDRLVDLLPESLPLYAGCTPGQVARMRGHLLAALGSAGGAGLPDRAIPFVVESLQTGTDAYELAGAAVGLRGCAHPPEGAVELVEAALIRIAGADATVDLSSVRAGTGPGTTARDELGRALDLLRGRPAGGHCCGAAPMVSGPPGPIVLQDQNGVERPFAECVRGPAVVAFFYTRCDNPYRCSATVARLAELRQRLGPRPVTIAAVSYDPDFDSPARLRRYGVDRGIVFDDHTAFYRATSGFAELRHWFGLGVNYAGSTVNRHTTELHVLDAVGERAASFTRTQWTVEQVLAVV
jgi:protein SCO1/2